ncbi:hypothetical protein L226DRAFT_525971 [Lentinus tigrinus ALCF2SS1-7]|uniref:Uncharacterized protein n=1 Tax=Lentinus tigrinus ALCF2SS1-6 TaxID=1328759 RepID=A0A5C2RU03_9APHY|nr:hypothetical protein L227DRAFT_567077 [Lentinus tigrinus ALCF2SS1-6]RPD70496.1 hypothetical protein L226DRAFT_525971 [Lentinus tigrinus ALCF2SS1-7]
MADEDDSMSSDWESSSTSPNLSEQCSTPVTAINTGREEKSIYDWAFHNTQRSNNNVQSSGAHGIKEDPRLHTPVLLPGPERRTGTNHSTRIVPHDLSYHQGSSRQRSVNVAVSDSLDGVSTGAPRSEWELPDYAVGGPSDGPQIRGNPSKEDVRDRLTLQRPLTMGFNKSTPAVRERHVDESYVSVPYQTNTDQLTTKHKSGNAVIHSKATRVIAPGPLAPVPPVRYNGIADTVGPVEHRAGNNSRHAFGENSGHKSTPIEQMHEETPNASNPADVLNATTSPSPFAHATGYKTQQAEPPGYGRQGYGRKVRDSMAIEQTYKKSPAASDSTKDPELHATTSPLPPTHAIGHGNQQTEPPENGTSHRVYEGDARQTYKTILVASNPPTDSGPRMTTLCPPSVYATGNGNQQDTPAVHRTGSRMVVTGFTSRIVTAPEIRRFASQDSFAEVIRKLYLPPDVPRWQQLVRAAVLIVGTVEEWVAEYATRSLDFSLTTPEFGESKEWIAEWLELQPLSRFPGTQSSIDHPSALLHPENIHPSEWALFWAHSRQVIFGVLLGLKLCSSHVDPGVVRSCRMENELWMAWMDDVTWVLESLLTLHGKTLLHPYVKFRLSSSIFVPRGSTGCQKTLDGGQPSMPTGQENNHIIQQKKRQLDSGDHDEGSDTKRPRPSLIQKSVAYRDDYDQQISGNANVDELAGDHEGSSA